ncbi:hypothetical protein GCM10009828_056580 [Actinoplanes couchii]|uniref:Uncharacterized protein n=1 Tax=Actinoplanes couchii TaxID=403638 RepID=A0ABQ3X1C7_9ACTN|nr:hypothetical protein Aco03nite_006810 [Actinoplanes couchii]
MVTATDLATPRRRYTHMVIYTSGPGSGAHSLLLGDFAAFRARKIDKSVMTRAQTRPAPNRHGPGAAGIESV